MSIEVIDISTGREVRSIAIGQMVAGGHDYALDARGLKPGNYVYKIIANSDKGKFIETKTMQIDNK